MKKQFLSYLNQQLAHNQKLLAMNSISEEDKVLLQEAVDSLTATIEEVNSMEESQESAEAIDALKTTVAEMQESLTAIKEKIQSEKKETNPETMENYLQSTNAVHDLCEAIRASKNSDQFMTNWNKALVQNGVTIASGSEYAYLPEIVKSKINDLWEKEAGFLSELRNTGAKRFTIRHNTADQDAADSRAKGWKKGQTKTQQALTLSAKLVEAQFIYKLQALDAKDQFDDDGSLLDYVLEELISQVLYEMRRCVLLGDSRADNSNDKITSFEAIARATTDAYVTVSTVTANGFLVDDFRAAIDAIENDSEKKIIAVMSKADLRTLSRMQTASDATPVYMGKEQVAEQLGVQEIITSKLVGENATYRMIAFIPDEYVLVGDRVLSPVLTSFDDILTNQTYWRSEVPAGGAVAGLKSAAVVKNA